MLASRFFVILLPALAGLGALRAEPAASARPEPPRFSVSYMNPGVEARVDFREYASGAWLKNTPIPGDKSRWSGFDELAQFNWAALKVILEEVSSKPQPEGSIEKKVADFYLSAMDTAAIDAAGLKPLDADLTALAAVQTPTELAHFIARQQSLAGPGAFGFGVGVDQKNSLAHAVYASQGGLSLPSRDYYFSESFAKQRAAFVEHVATMLTLAGVPEEQAKAEAATVLSLETGLAEKARTPVELRDRLANYNRMTVQEFFALAPSFPWKDYLRLRGFSDGAVNEVVVGQPEFFRQFEVLFTTRPVAEWKAYLRYRLLNASADELASAFEKERFRFYGTVLQGTPAQEPRWQKAARLVDGSIGEALGRLYVERYYPAEARARMSEMITNIKAVMRERLEKLDWMTDATRARALAKFDRFVARIGHPDTFRTYEEVPVSRDSLFANVRAADVAELNRSIAKLGKPVDRSEWSMTPPTVNAYFQPTANQIVFPAGILQPPFFDFTLDDAVNYGAIGAVIGHEITHGFDDQGRRYDAEGNLNDWWTPEDATQFAQRAAKLIQQYSSQEALPGLRLNGALSLGENIADLGGVSIAFEAFQRSLAGKERKLVDGLTPEQRFFISWTQQWRTLFREEALRRQVTVGPHSPGMFRAVLPLTNLQAFFEAFGIKEGDPMWRKPEDRVKIW